MRHADLDFDHALPVDLAFELGLDRAVGLVSSLSRAVDLEVLRALDLDLGLDLDRALNLVDDLAVGLIRALNVVRELDVALDLDLDHALGLNHDLGRRLAVIRGIAHALVRELERVLDRDREGDQYLDCATDHARAVADAFDAATGAASRLTAALQDNSSPVAMGAAPSTEPVAVSVTAGLARSKEPAAVAIRLVRGVVRVLPASSRGRYHEEFGSELHDLAAAGASWCTQLGYALRLLGWAWVLRAELRDTKVRRVPS